MSDEKIALLTEKEREALRLVPTHGSLQEIANVLGISESAVKQRLASASRKLGASGRRHKAARILMEAEGWPYPDRTGPNRQVEEPAPSAVNETTGVEDGSRSVPLPLAQQAGGFLLHAGARVGGFGTRNRLTAWQRLAVIGLVTLASLLLFSMVIATMTEVGRFHRSLARGHANSA